MGISDNAQLSDRQSQLLTDLRSWATLQEIITDLSDEQELKWLMQAEQNGQNRIRVLNRLYSRFCVVRKERELRDISEGKLPFGEH